MPHTYDFDHELAFANGIAQDADFTKILLENIPAAQAIIPASQQEDRNGTDYWITRPHGRNLSVDLKSRKEDYKAKANCDDLALETWSDVDAKTVGWTRDPKKQTDYVLWYWLDTCRWCLVPFPMLCHVFRLHWHDWLKEFPHAVQQSVSASQNTAWRSQCVFVPRKLVWRTIYDVYAGENPPANISQKSLQNLKQAQLPGFEP